MEDVLVKGLDEIALSGLEGKLFQRFHAEELFLHCILGCTLAELWQAMGLAEPSAQDEPEGRDDDVCVRRYLWRQLCQCEHLLKFYLLPRPRDTPGLPTALEVP